MVSSVGGSPYFSYLSQLQGTPKPATPPAASAATPAATTADSSSGVSALLGNGSGSFSPEILSLLQQNSAGNFDPISSLLGGTSTNNPLTSLFANLFASVTSASLAQAQTNGTADKTAAATPASPVQNLLNAQTQASLAYNSTNLQNARNITSANSYQSDGVTPLVA